MSSGPVATAYPAGHHSPPEVTTNSSQCVVPRATSSRSISRTTSALRSIQSRNGGEYRPSTTSGPSHQALAVSIAAVHHHVVGERHHRLPGQQPEPGGHGGEDGRGGVHPAAAEHGDA